MPRQELAPRPVAAGRWKGKGKRSYAQLFLAFALPPSVKQRVRASRTAHQQSLSDPRQSEPSSLDPTQVRRPASFDASLQWEPSRAANHEALRFEVVKRLDCVRLTGALASRGWRGKGKRRSSARSPNAGAWCGSQAQQGRLETSWSPRKLVRKRARSSRFDPPSQRQAADCASARPNCFPHSRILAEHVAGLRHSRGQRPAPARCGQWAGCPRSAGITGRPSGLKTRDTAG